MGGRIVIAFAAMLCATALSARAEAQAPPLRTVLTITAGTENFPANPIIDAGVRDALASRTDLPIDYFTEYLESDFFPGEAASMAFRDYLRAKYGGRRIDVVIAMTDQVLNFVLAHRAELFPGAPVVYMGVVVPGESVRTAGAGLTGLKVGVAYAETLRLALELQPSTQQVLVVAKGREGAIEAVRSELRDSSPKVRLTYLTEKSVPELLAKVKAAPPRSVILYIWHTQQDPGHVVYADAVARQVAQAASAPVYGTSDFYIGSGVVGGVVRDTRESGTHLGQMALRVLTGTRAIDIPIETARTAPILDWRQLRRWGISETRAPADAQIRFREPGVWTQYKGYIFAATAILLAQSGLIGGLLIQARRRRRAEARIRDLGSRLLGAQEAERSRIARELHDDVSQQTALLSIDLQLLIESDPDEPETREELARKALRRTETIAQTVHALSHRLHPAKLQLMGLVPSLSSLQREFSKTGVAVTFTHRNVPDRLPFDLTLCLFRVVQEALQNAVKHGSARKVTVDLTGNPRGLSLTIVDDGVGFEVDALSAKGLGLVSMKERLEPLGGTLEIHSRPGAGTRLNAFVPAPPPASTAASTP
jgi:signal transduction histidine kinase